MNDRIRGFTISSNEECVDINKLLKGQMKLMGRQIL
jgi:hypothetical protein